MAKVAKEKVVKVKKPKKEKERPELATSSIWLVEKAGEYLTGVFLKTKEVNNFLIETRKAGKDSNQVTRMARCTQFPVYILEHEEDGKKHFVCFDEKKSAHENYKDNKLKKGVIYEVTENFASIGKNQMSTLKSEKA